MPPPPDRPAPFDRLGPPEPALPLVVSVPHAGRDYPARLLSQSRLPVEALVALEDRHADALAAGLPALGLTTFVARRARAWIDLNRDERELDPAMLTPMPRAATLLSTPKVRGGLGLIPRRVAGAGEIMGGRLSMAEVEARIATDHRPWHQAIADALDQARARFGVALLLDLHSMPPLAAAGGRAAPRIVVGDRHGHAAAARFVNRVRKAAATCGYEATRNAPYAGGHTLDRHGRPPAAIHAIQLEVDRSLYLAPDLHTPGEGLAETAALVTELARALLDELAAAATPPAIAAE